MADNEDTSSSIEQRQRKEKKDLQAKIQSLKKSAGKGDKKKKKEVLDEIVRLETELEIKHLEELKLIQNTEPSTVIEKVSEAIPKISNIKSEVLPKISKAQKRRDKKAAEEKAREESILKQEEENINGPRNTETRAIKLLLKEKGLCLYNIPSNGDCLYGAISHQLSTVHNKSISVHELRQMSSDHIRSNKYDFLPFLSNPETFDLLTDDQFDDYCDKVANSNTWGGQVELQALTTLLQCPIHILQSTSPSVITQGEEYKSPPLLITYHRHMFGLGEHYNSTQKPSDIDLDNIENSS